MKRSRQRRTMANVLAGTAAFSAMLLGGASLARSEEPVAKTPKTKETVTYAKHVSRIVQASSWISSAAERISSGAAASRVGC